MSMQTCLGSTAPPAVFRLMAEFRVDALRGDGDATRFSVARIYVYMLSLDKDKVESYTMKLQRIRPKYRPRRRRID